MQTTGKKQPISLYFHIPFCTRKCDYCHFYVLPDQEAAKDVLLNCFQLEWERWLPVLKNHQLATIYFGGGTPSLFGPSRIQTVLSWVKQVFPLDPQCEITLEANPENVNLQLIKAYKESGVNRISLGLQTLDNHLLSLLGRIHSSKTSLDAVYLVKEAGISNISVDLMYDLPEQHLAQWEYTLKEVAHLPITHLSLYNLTIEPHTVFFKKQKQLSPLIPDPDTSLAMYQMAISYLENAGLSQYEISAFSKLGYQSCHNVGYWTGRSFLGFGPSAFSYWEGKRFRCISHLNRYYQALKTGKTSLDFEEELDLQAKRRELFVVQLRLREGVSLLAFEQHHGRLDPSTLVQVSKLAKEGLLDFDQNTIRLTTKGVLFYDLIASELI